MKCCVGSKPWMLVRFALNNKSEYLDGFGKQYLDMLGFIVKSGDNQLALVDGASRCRKAQADDSVFVHCCFEEGNLLSKISRRPRAEGN